MDSVFSLTRAILVIFIPGAVTVAPWLLLAINGLPNFADIYTKYQSPFHAVAFTLVVVVGTLFEGCVSYFEHRWDSAECITPEPKPVEDWLNRDWYDYLSFRFGDKEPVAYRYLSRKVTELYFYLSMMLATPIGILGFGAILISHYGSHCIIAGCSVFLAIFSILLLRRFAKDSHCLLYNTRFEVMRRLRNAPDKR